jgi:hypothetical protein
MAQIEYLLGAIFEEVKFNLDFRKADSEGLAERLVTLYKNGTLEERSAIDEVFFILTGFQFEFFLFVIDSNENKNGAGVQ